jgi:phospholipid transport system transporter-binding protein
VVILPAILTQSQAAACLAIQVPVLRAVASNEVQVDASRLDQFDSSALAVLLAFRREALTLGKQLVVVGMPEQLSHLAKIYGIAELIQTA